MIDLFIVDEEGDYYFNGIFMYRCLQNERVFDVIYFYFIYLIILFFCFLKDLEIKLFVCLGILKMYISYIGVL